VKVTEKEILQWLTVTLPSMIHVPDLSPATSGQVSTSQHWRNWHSLSHLCWKPVLKIKK